MKRFLIGLWTFFYSKDESGIEEISMDEYHELFIRSRELKDKEKMYDIAWEARRVVIDNYWKRASYYWAFQVAAFAGYFTVLGSKAYIETPQVLYFVVCMGCITSFAWTMTNIQSSNSQKRWETHIDMLEDEITGPLSKVVSNIKTHSITKISEIVSRFFVAIWIVLAIKYFSEHTSTVMHRLKDIDYQIWFSSLITIYFSSAMRFGYGRRKYTIKPIQFYKRIFPKM